MWTPLVFECNLRAGYDEIVPPHFILIDRLRAPWTLGNMLSVFKERGGRWARLDKGAFSCAKPCDEGSCPSRGKKLEQAL